MATLKQIIEAAQSKNIKVSTEYQNENLIGFKTGPSVWHWFEVLDGEENPYLIFRQSYSQNTGNQKRGFSHGFKVKTNISKKIGIEI